MTTSSIPTDSSPWLSAASIGAALAIFGALALTYVVGVRQDVLQQAQITRAVAQENADFCMKLGIGRNTDAHAACVEGLSHLRRRHDERYQVQFGGIL